MFTDSGFDGRWSPLSRLLLRLHALPREQLLISTGWCISPQNFRCPVCLRMKPELLIPGRAGGMLALLHIDHDHQADLICEMAASLRIDPSYLDRLLCRFLRYPPLLLCGPCNHIDSRLKLVYPDIHPAFSLTPEEKASLLIRAGSRSHKTDLRAGRDIWLKRRDDFSAMIDLWENELNDLSDSGDGLLCEYRPKKRLLSEAARRYSRVQAAYNCFYEFHEFIHRSLWWQSGDSFSNTSGEIL
ncbi:MAG: hypothetical protein H6618_01460 [Deltaproteobacteria bacterium]|nr:hypothetical protein [Deltaproteobacteria bacterium]